jgi:flagellar motility protein MotE (MotC chaperone)
VAVAADSVTTLPAEVARIVTVVKGLSHADGAAVISLLDDHTALEVLRAVGYSRAALLIGELPEARAASLGSGLVRTLTAEPGTK